MKITPSRTLKQGFTLIELLIVIGIIATLAALAIPGTQMAMRQAKKVKTQAALKDLTVGIKQYQVEYNRYPVPSGSTSEEPIQLSEGSQILSVLLGGDDQPQLNPRQIAFIEPTPAKNGVGGLTGDQGAYAYTDLWGEAYYVVMDVDYNNRVTNPDAQNEDSLVSDDAPQELVMGAIAYSTGEDKKERTKDDIASWR
jgi:prepilin-type N-terminal cleavage/methylation domain-containing protein